MKSFNKCTKEKCKPKCSELKTAIRAQRKRIKDLTNNRNNWKGKYKKEEALNSNTRGIKTTYREARMSRNIIRPYHIDLGIPIHLILPV